MMYSWGPAFIAWAVSIFTVTAIVVGACVAALIADARRRGIHTTDTSPLAPRPEGTRTRELTHV